MKKEDRKRKRENQIKKKPGDEVNFFRVSVSTMS